MHGTGYWPGWDIARDIAIRPDGAGGWVLDAHGALHPSGNAPRVAVSAYWPGWDIARAVVVRAGGESGWVVDARGKRHPFTS